MAVGSARAPAARPGPAKECRRRLNLPFPRPLPVWVGVSQCSSLLCCREVAALGR